MAGGHGVLSSVAAIWAGIHHPGWIQTLVALAGLGLAVRIALGVVRGLVRLVVVGALVLTVGHLWISAAGAPLRATVTAPQQSWTAWTTGVRHWLDEGLQGVLAGHQLGWPPHGVLNTPPTFDPTPGHPVP